MAPSYDAVITHPSSEPPSIIEGLQFKSSGHIAVGDEPSKYLELGTKEKPSKDSIWSEYLKVIDSDHERFHKTVFPNGYQLQLAVISNKPLKNYNEVSQATLNNQEGGLPPRVILVSYDNFKKFAGAFAHRGLLKEISKSDQAPPSKKKSKAATSPRKPGVGQKRNMCTVTKRYPRLFFI